MKKEEILKRAQAEKTDEREKQVSILSFRWNYLTMAIVAAVFTCFRAMRGQQIVDLCAVCCFSVCSGMFYRFVKTKDKSCLLTGLITFVVACFATVGYFMGY